MPEPTQAELNALAHIHAVREQLVVKLYKNDPPHGAGTVLGDFVECDFPGYAEKPPGGLSQPLPFNGGAVARTNRIFFEQTGPGTQRAYGYFLVQRTPGGDLLYTAKRFDLPVMFDTEGKVNSFIIELEVRDAFGMGGEAQANVFNVLTMAVLSSKGVNGMRKKKWWRGNDRKYLKRLLRELDLIKARDGRIVQAPDATKTSAYPILFDPEGHPGLPEAVQLLESRLEQLLAWEV